MRPYLTSASLDDPCHEYGSWRGTFQAWQEHAAGLGNSLISIRDRIHDGSVIAS